jgi:Flp pilus assembly protein CpaB
MADLGTAPRRASGPRARNGEGSRLIRRRGRLPAGRAVVGGFLVAASAVGLFAAYSAATAGPRHSYVIAAGPLEVGHRLTADDLAVVATDLPDLLRARSFTDPEALIGATVVAQRAPGELLHASDLVRIDGERGTRELSFSVDASRALGDRITPGEHVDVVATYGAGRDAYTVVVVSATRVLRAQPAPGGLVADTRVQLTVELLDAGQMLALAHAVDVGQITVVRSTAATEAPTSAGYRPVPDPPSQDAGLRDGD